MSKRHRAIAALAAAVLAAGAIPQVTLAATTVTVREADLIAALSDTRSAGHVTFLTDGLHVETDDTSSEAKAAEYFPASGSLPATASLTWFGTDAEPGQQIVFDVDATRGNGNDFNILVGESIYGDVWWLTASSSDAAKAADPSGGNNSGSGSEWFGTLAEWGTALPDTEVLAGGFSLGSGVKGDGVIDRIEYDDTTFRFTSVAAPVAANVTGSFTTAKDKDGLRVTVTLISDAQPPNTTLGEKLVWKVEADGKVILKAEQGFSDYDRLRHKFAKNSGKHEIEIFKNGTLVKTVTVKTAR